MDVRKTPWVPGAGAMAVALAVLGSAGCALAPGREQAVCGVFLEPLVFALWSSRAPAPDERLLDGLVGVDAYSFVAGDGKTLRGYRIRARDDSDQIIDNPRGFVLIAPGNAMTASHLVAHFEFLSAHGNDIYIIDYRGYGHSEGYRRLLAMTVDHAELIEHLSAQYPHSYLLGLSLGGIVILKAMREGAPFTKAIIDSPPSTVSQFGCPPAFDPASNLPSDASNVLVITGGRDQVIPPAASAELIDRARAAGAQVLYCTECGHPLGDADPLLRAWRFSEWARFLSEPESTGD